MGRMRTAVHEPVRRRTSKIVAVLSAGTVLNPLDATMIAVALPAMQRDFQVSVVTVSWLVSGFFLAGAVGQTLMGRLADEFGPRRVFRVGLLVVAVSSLAAAVSPSFGWLLGFRVVQALGTSVAFPAGLSILRYSLSERDGAPPARAIGAVTTVNATSAAVGPFLGGVLVASFGWHATFLVNIPIAVAATVMAGWWLPPDPKRFRTRTVAVGSSLDLLGAFLYSSTLLGLLSTLLLGLHGPLWLVAGAVPLLLGIFIWWERRVRRPFLDVRMLAARPLVLAIFAQYALANLAHYSVLYAVPQWLQSAREVSPTVAGLVVLPVAACGAVIAPFAARWIDLRGPRPTLVAASATLAVGAGLLLVLTPTSPLFLVAGVAAVLGVFNNPNTLGLQSVLYRVAPSEQTGSVSGMFQSFRYVGSILSTTVLAAAFHHSGGDLTVVAVVALAVATALTALTVLIARPR